MSVKETVTLLKNLSQTMQAEAVGDDKADVEEWASIREAIAKLCKALADAKSVEEWTETITAIEEIKNRVSKMPTSTSHWIKSHVNTVLDQCVQMIERLGGKAPQGKDSKTKEINKLLQAMKDLIHDYEAKSRQ
jgi:NurA-like 5'-3' nuclease